MLTFVYLVPLPDSNIGLNSTRAQNDIFSGLKSLDTDTSLVLARPLFHRNRRPPAKEVKIAVPEAPEVRREVPYRLVGVVGSSETNRSAYLQSTDTNETIVAKVGSTVDVWIVDTIGSNFITLVHDGERKVLELSGGG